MDCENDDCLVILMFQSNLSQKVEVQDWLVRRVSSWLEDSWSSKSSSPSSGSLVLDPGSHPHFHFLILEMDFSIFSRLSYWVLLLSLDLNTLVSIDHPSQARLLSLSIFSSYVMITLITRRFIFRFFLFKSFGKRCFYPWKLLIHQLKGIFYKFVGECPDFQIGGLNRANTFYYEFLKNVPMVEQRRLVVWSYS